MDRAAIDPAIKCILSEIAKLTADAARISKAAEACALAGSIAEGVTVRWTSNRSSMRQAACKMQLHS
jgi:NADPH-dependent ferric siderophore reductase